MNESKPLMRCRKDLGVTKTGIPVEDQDQVQEKPADCLSGDRHIEGMTPIWALMWNVGTLALMLRENSKWLPH